MERLEIRRFRTSLKDARSKPHPSLNAHKAKSDLPPDIAATISAPFDKQIERLNALRAQLGNIEAAGASQPRPSPHPDILPSTIAALDRMLRIPLLPTPKEPTFEEAFRRFEPMFHTVFYRKYHPTIRDDMKQVAFIALFKKWRKDPDFLDNKASYVVTAAIYGVSNWRQKQMKARRQERRMQVDGHDKVIGATRAQREHDAWAQPIDRRIDVDLARSAVLFQYPNAEEREWASNIVSRLKLGHNRISTTMRSRVKKRQFYIVKTNVLKTLRTQLADYASIQTSGVIFEGDNP
jgi:hypothetical protein